MRRTRGVAGLGSGARRPLLAATALLGAVLGGHATPAWGAGDAEAGRRAFADKGCPQCHVPRGQPSPGLMLELLKRPQGAMELAGWLWNHLSQMADALGQGRLGWPKISPSEMADLMAFLEADPSRDPRPDAGRGQVALVRKGCLKCHALRGEGGRVQPDLAEKRTDYDSPAAWAAAMWAHTPAMAAMASRMGIPYPRFVGDDMTHLIGYLRCVAETP